MRRPRDPFRRNGRRCRPPRPAARPERAAVRPVGADGTVRRSPRQPSENAVDHHCVPSMPSPDGQPHVVWGLAGLPHFRAPGSPLHPASEMNQRAGRCGVGTSTTGANLEQARHDPRSPFCRPDAARRHRLAGDTLPARPATARLRGLVYRGWRGQSLRPPRRQRHDGMRVQRRLSAAGDGKLRARRPLGLLGRDQRCVARAGARTGAAALRRGGRADQSVRRHQAARGASGLPGSHHDRHRSRLRADQICQGRPRGPRLSRRPHPLFQLRREFGSGRLPGAAVRDRLAADPAAGGARAVARGEGRPPLLHHRRHLGEQGQGHRIRRLPAMSGRSM